MLLKVHKKQSENFEDHVWMYQHRIIQIILPPHFASQRPA